MVADELSLGIGMQKFMVHYHIINRYTQTP